MAEKGTVAFPGAGGDVQWWQSSIVYQVYPRSYQDSTGDGVGDIRGIISRLDHIKSLGVGAVWLSPFYKSPMKDHGYDISDFQDVDPVFGSLEDFEDLVRGIHERGMRIILDYVPNHSSDQHRWFKESRKSRDNPYSDYYIWHDGTLLEDGTRAPPNNWLACFGGPAWTWDEGRQQYYYRQYLPEQPDLNWRNPKVVQEMQDVLEFWLDKGVDGFRVDAIASLYEVTDVSKNEPLSGHPDYLPGMSHYLDHIYTRHQHETYLAVAGWRTFLDEYERKHNREHIYCIVELYDPTMVNQMKFYNYGADGAFNFNLVEVTAETDAMGVFNMVNSWLEKMPKGGWPNWVTGNHDRRRVTGKKGARFTNAFNALLLLLPGTPTTYEGEEIGMLDLELSYDDTVDPCGRNAGPEHYKRFTRDPARSPMQWSTDKNAGFSSADQTWLPVQPDYARINVKAQEASSDPRTPLLFYRAVSKLRTAPSFRRGAMLYGLVTGDVFSFVRHFEGSTPYLVAINFAAETAVADLSLEFSGRKFKIGSLIMSAVADEAYETGMTLELTEIKLASAQALIIELIM